MAQSIQIVPKHSFPYVETVINDYTLVNDTDVSEPTADTVVRYIFPFVSSKGIDNKFIRKRSRSEIVSAYGDTNWKKYGQPLMQALQASEASNTEIWCMRVMPDDATYAHNIISAYYKGDTDDEVATASKRKFRIKYLQKTALNNVAITNVNTLKTEARNFDGPAANGVYTDSEGYTQIPGVITLYSAGRGTYGNNYRVRVSQDIYYEKDYGIKYYNFEVISTESGLKKEATYVGSTVTSTKYNHATFITDVLTDVDEGIVPVFIDVDENGIEDLYNAYKEWVSDLALDLEDELTTVENTEVTGTTDTETAQKEAEKQNKITELKNLINEATNVPDIDAFDALLGRKVSSIQTNPFIYFPSPITSDVDLKDGETEDDYLFNANYTSSVDENGVSTVVSWDSVTGAKLFGGSDGASFNTTDNNGQTILERCYINAFNGTYDKRILTPKRIKANALWDANYPMSVKNEMANLALLRNDAICYLDCGIMTSFGNTELDTLIEDYSVFNDYKISKNVHHYYIKESTTKKRVPVTITYFLSRQYADHVLNYGSYIPFVKTYAQLTGHVKDSLAPSVEDFEVELKETLTENRFNFFETVDDNVYQRATQNTSQMTTSDLLEESNVSTLYDIKRIVEADIVDRLYDFSDAEARQRFRNYEVAKFADWSGREVESFDIDFRMTDWEAERSVLHAYIDVTFRGLQKRAILEIDVNKRASETAAE